MDLYYSSTWRPQGAIVFDNVKSKRWLQGGLKQAKTGHNKLVAQTWKKAKEGKIEKEKHHNRRKCKGRYLWAELMRV